MADYNSSYDHSPNSPSATDDGYTSSSSNRSSADVRVYDKVDDSLAKIWGIVPRPDPISGTSPDLGGVDGLRHDTPGHKNSFEAVDETTSSIDGPHNCSQPSNTNVRLPTACQQPPLESVEFHSGGATTSGASPPDNTFCEDVSNSYQPSSGPSRTGQISTRRSGPYGPSRARAFRRRRAVNPRRPNTSGVGLPTVNPAGGSIPAITDDAPEKETPIEGNETPKWKRDRLPNGKGKVRIARWREIEDLHELRRLVQRWKQSRKLPTQYDAIADALKYISTVRIQVYEHPRLAKLEASRSEGCSARAMMERERRDKERDLFKELSQYYPLEVVGESDVNRRVWERPNLLKEVLDDLKVRHPPPELSMQSTPPAPA